MKERDFLKEYLPNLSFPQKESETKIHVQIVNKGEGPGRTIRKWWERWKGADFLRRPPPRGAGDPRPGWHPGL